MGITRRARFQYIGMGQESMQRIADKTQASVLSRIQRGETVNDTPAKPLRGKRTKKRPPYIVQKERKGRKAIRDWTLTGHTLSQMRVMFVSATQAVIGFLSGFGPNRRISAPQIVALRNRDEKQFGMSPQDTQAMHSAVHQEVLTKSPVQAVSVPVGK